MVGSKSLRHMYQDRAHVANLTLSCFYSLRDMNVATHKDKPEGEFVVPGMPMRVELTKGTWPLAFFSPPSWEAFLEERNERSTASW